MPARAPHVPSWRQSPRRLLIALGAITVGAAAALGWLGWEMVRQDSELAAQYERERLESDADRLVQELERRIGDVEASLTEWLDAPETTAARSRLPGSGVVVKFTPTSVQPLPPARLVFYPVLPPQPEPPAPALFADAVVAEFREKNFGRAAELYRTLAQSADPPTRAAALLGMQGALRKAGRTTEALAALVDLEKLGDVLVPDVGQPAELVARSAQLGLLDRLDHQDDVRREAEALVEDLASGRWMLAQGQYEHLIEAAARAAGLAVAPQRGVALATAVAGLWDDWQAQLALRDRRLRRVDDGVFLEVRSGAEDRLAAWIVDPADLVREVSSDPALTVLLSDADGPLTSGAPDRVPSNVRVIRTPAETRLPWTTEVVRMEGTDVGDGITRTQFVVSGLVLMLALLAAGSYFIGRAIVREMELVRLQADFVSAVSHEFRTPLAAMRQLSELLAAGRVPHEAKRQHYYESLAGESRRLQRLVENLLNFGRLEAGGKPYRLEPIDPHALVEDVVAGYRSQLAQPDCRIEIGGAAGHGTAVMADREAVALALHNLLDNAVKYSGKRPVRVDLAEQDDRIAIRVRDEGPGIALEEQGRIFGKFVRGASAANVPGTGVGLAMVQLVAAGHGGDVTVESQPGAGATFTLLLPAARVEPEARPSTAEA